MPSQLDHSKGNENEGGGEDNLLPLFLAIPICKKPHLFTLKTSESTKFTLTFLVLQVIPKHHISDLFKYYLTGIAMGSRTKPPGHKPPDKNPLAINPPDKTYEHKIYFYT